MVEANLSDHNNSVCRLLQTSVLKFCQENYLATSDIEVDAIICLSPINSSNQNVIKIHQILPQTNFKHKNGLESDETLNFYNGGPKVNTENRIQIYKKRRKIAVQRRNLNFSNRTSSVKSADTFYSQGLSKRKSSCTLRIPSVSYMQPHSKSNSVQIQNSHPRSFVRQKSSKNYNGHHTLASHESLLSNTSHLVPRSHDIKLEDDGEPFEVSHMTTESGEERVDSEIEQNDVDKVLLDADIPKENSSTFQNDSYVIDASDNINYGIHTNTSSPDYQKDSDLPCVNGNMPSISKQNSDGFNSLDTKTMYLEEHGVVIKSEPPDFNEYSNTITGTFHESEKFGANETDVKSSNRRKRKQTPKQIIRKDNTWNWNNQEHNMLTIDQSDVSPENDLEEDVSTGYTRGKGNHTPRLVSLLKKKFHRSSPGANWTKSSRDIEFKPLLSSQQAYKVEPQDYIWEALDDTSMDMADVESIKKTANSGKLSMFLSPEKKKRIKTEDTSIDVKNFFCSKCGTGFRSKKSKMRHEKYTCGDLPNFECFVCGKFYSRADSKTRHLWKIHGIKLLTPDKSVSMNSSVDEDRLGGLSLAGSDVNPVSDGLNDSIVVEQENQLNAVEAPWKIHGIKHLTTDKSVSMNSSMDEDRLGGLSLAGSDVNPVSDGLNESIAVEQENQLNDVEAPSIDASD